MMSASRVLVVCTANVCRSALGEVALRRLLAGLPAEVVVESAGTAADPGAPMCAQGADRAGIESGAHAARELTEGLIAQADLVVAADRTHRKAAVRILPSARDRIFTLSEAAVLASAVVQALDSGTLPPGAPPLPQSGAERLAWLVGEMNAARGLVVISPPENLDIEDAHGPQDHLGTLERVESTMSVLAAAMLAVAQARGGMPPGSAAGVA